MVRFLLALGISPLKNQKVTVSMNSNYDKNVMSKISDRKKQHLASTADLG